ncbi:MAG: radical SAM protein, partial [Nitrospirae bacterium]|nr:radical SAM protein [Nitrospirota bacterium]
GIYATLYHEHAVHAGGADFVFRGPLSESLNIALYTFGFRLMRKKDAVPYYKLPFCSHYPFAALRTSEGCPFRCPYCASELLSDAKYARSSAADVMNEIAELYSRGVRDYALYDDAFLHDADNHAKPILKSIAHFGLPVRFHTPNGLHARFVDDEVARLMSNFKTVRLSLETTDRQRQRNTGDKVTNSDLADAVELFKQNGFKKDELGVYLMYGLPGQELPEVIESVNFLKSLDVRIYLAEFSPVKGTRSWNDLVQNGIIEDAIDPLLTNNTVFSFFYSGYDSREVRSLKLAVKAHNEE